MGSGWESEVRLEISWRLFRDTPSDVVMCDWSPQAFGEKKTTCFGMRWVAMGLPEVLFNFWGFFRLYAIDWVHEPDPREVSSGSTISPCGKEGSISILSSGILIDWPAFLPRLSFSAGVSPKKVTQT